MKKNWPNPRRRKIQLPVGVPTSMYKFHYRLKDGSQHSHLGLGLNKEKVIEQGKTIAASMKAKFLRAEFIGKSVWPSK